MTLGVHACLPHVAICLLHVHVATCCYVESTQRIDVSHQIIVNVHHGCQVLHGCVLVYKSFYYMYMHSSSPYYVFPNQNFVDVDND